MTIAYQINAIDLSGAQAQWERVVLRTNNDGTVDLHPWAGHTITVPNIDDTTFASIQALQGQAVTLQTSGVNAPNTQTNYSNAIVQGVIGGTHSGIIVDDVQINLRVKVA